MQPAHIGRPLQREPRLLDANAHRAEEQLAFHERYHDRMARLLGSGARTAEPAPYTQFRDPAPDYWADYTRKLEEMGVVRDEGSAMPPPPPSSCAPADASSVLGRLDWLARERDEPDAADVIELLRDVEDVLEREKDTERSIAVATAPRPPPSATTPTAAPSFQSQQQQQQQQQRKEQVQQQQNYLNQQQRVPLQAPSPQQHYPMYHQNYPLSNGAGAGGVVGGTSFSQPADWSRMSSNQQMEWYRVYYAWMVYYAQYYGAVLAAQQQQQQQQQHEQGQQEQVQVKPQGQRKSTGKTPNQAMKTQTDFRKLTEEYCELAAEVERLKKESRRPRDFNPPSRAASLRPARREQHTPQRRPTRTAREYEEDDTLYRSEHRHSHLRSAPQRPRAVEPKATTTTTTRASMESLRGTSRGSTSKRFDPPWLPPASRAQSEEEEEQVWGDEEDRGERKVLPRSRCGQPAERDIAWLYKYEEEGEGRSDMASETGTREGRDDRWDDGPADGVSTRRAQGLQEAKRHLSVYERKRQELKNEKPRWGY